MLFSSSEVALGLATQEGERRGLIQSSKKGESESELYRAKKIREKGDYTEPQTRNEGIICYQAKKEREAEDDTEPKKRK